jgi:Flp pilus assembly protein TadG
MKHQFTMTRRILRDREGAVIIEFAILAPLVLGLMIGVFQVGLGMQAYNSMRSVAGEAARYAAVEYQKGNSPDNDAIETQAIAIATADPYILDPSVAINVTDAAVQRVTGAREMTITITYTVPTFLPFFDWASPTLTHSRPIFVLD